MTILLGFMMGFLAGFLAAIGVFALLVYWVCTRCNQIAIARAVNGLANALATRAKSSKPATPAADGQTMEDPEIDLRGRGHERTASRNRH